MASEFEKSTPTLIEQLKKITQYLKEKVWKKKEE